jgi:hypothetical protein
MGNMIVLDEYNEDKYNSLWDIIQFNDIKFAIKWYYL